jgi:hypothetical protein
VATSPPRHRAPLTVEGVNATFPTVEHDQHTRWRLGPFDAFYVRQLDLSGCEETKQASHNLIRGADAVAGSRRYSVIHNLERVLADLGRTADSSATGNNRPVIAGGQIFGRSSQTDNRCAASGPGRYSAV